VTICCSKVLSIMLIAYIEISGKFSWKKQRDRKRHSIMIDFFEEPLSSADSVRIWGDDCPSSTEPPTPTTFCAALENLLNGSDIKNSALLPQVWSLSTPFSRRDDTIWIHIKIKNINKRKVMSHIQPKSIFSANESGKIHGDLDVLDRGPILLRELYQWIISSNLDSMARVWHSLKSEQPDMPDSFSESRISTFRLHDGGKSP
jgi:hypothetical protein